MVNSLAEFAWAGIIFCVFEKYLPHSKRDWRQASVLFQGYRVTYIPCPICFHEIILKGYFLSVKVDPSDRD